METASLTIAGSTSPITDDTGDGDGDSDGDGERGGERGCDCDGEGGVIVMGRRGRGRRGGGGGLIEGYASLGRSNSLMTVIELGKDESESCYDGDRAR